VIVATQANRLPRNGGYEHDQATCITEYARRKKISTDTNGRTQKGRFNRAPDRVETFVIRIERKVTTAR